MYLGLRNRVEVADSLNEVGGAAPPGAPKPTPYPVITPHRSACCIGSVSVYSIKLTTLPSRNFQAWANGARKLLPVALYVPLRWPSATMEPPSPTSSSVAT